MATDKVTVTNQMMIHSLMDLLNDLYDQNLKMISVNAQTIDGKRHFGVEIIGDYSTDETEDMAIKTGDTLKIEFEKEVPVC